MVRGQDLIGVILYMSRVGDYIMTQNKYMKLKIYLSFSDYLFNITTSSTYGDYFICQVLFLSILYTLTHLMIVTTL